MPDPTPSAPATVAAAAPPLAPATSTAPASPAPQAEPPKPAAAPVAATAPVPPPAPQSVPAPVPALSKPPQDISKPADPAAKTNVANLPPSPAPTAPVVPTPVLHLPEEAPYRFAEIPADKLDQAKADEAVARAKAEFADAKTFVFGQSVAHAGYEQHGTLQGYNATTGKVLVMFPQAEGNPARSVEFDKDGLFNPEHALAIYTALTTPPPSPEDQGAATAPAVPPSLGSVPPVLLTLFAIGLGLLMACSGCTATATAPGAVTASKTAPAKLGAIVRAVESPSVVKTEVYIATSEVLQRAVKADKQATVAGWSSCIARGIMDLAGTTNPNADDLRAAIEKETGPQTDPEFPIILSTATDLFGVLKAAIPPGSTAATVESYLYAAATGVQNAATDYLPPSAVSVGYVVLESRHEAFLADRRRAARPRRV